MRHRHFDDWIAEHYEVLAPELFEPETIDPTVDFLAHMAGDGPVLELGIGTGRVALPLSRRGLRVHGIELSEPMVQRLRGLDGAGQVDVTLGDFSSTDVGATFALVYLVRNTITNVITQDAQVATFRNAATHLVPGGCFVVENYVPNLQRLPPGETTYVFTASPSHLGFEEYDLDAQIAVSHHYWTIDGEVHTVSSAHRYAWPAELDLMAQLAGLTLRERWADWRRTPFTGASRGHVSVWVR